MRAMALVPVDMVYYDGEADEEDFLHGRSSLFVGGLPTVMNSSSMVVSR